VERSVGFHFRGLENVDVFQQERFDIKEGLINTLEKPHVMVFDCIDSFPKTLLLSLILLSSPFSLELIFGVPKENNVFISERQEAPSGR